MTREILFRGKRLDNGDWVEGNLITGTHWLDKNEIAAIVPLDNTFYPRCEITCWFEVDPSTICQFVGLCDKNGKKIFEGDIVPIWENGEEYNYKVVYNADCFMLAMLDSVQGSYPLSSKHNQTKVIGNIYDNPELLEGEG